MADCKYESPLGDWRCPRSAVKGFKMCLVHLPKEHGGSLREEAVPVLREILKNKSDFIRFDGIVLPGPGLLEFAGIAFEHSVSFCDAEFRSHLADFKGARFLGPKTIFHRARFENGVDFSDASFSGLETDFSEARFSFDTQFLRTEFHSCRTTFKGTAFHCDSHRETSFRGATFLGKAEQGTDRLVLIDFSHSRFRGGKTLFQGAKFLSDHGDASSCTAISFQHEGFSSEVDFQGVQFDLDVYFNGRRFEGVANFTGTKFSRNADFRGCRFCSETVFGERCRFGEVADFRHAQFDEPKGVRFHRIGHSPEGEEPLPWRVRFRRTNLIDVSFVDNHWYSENRRPLVLQDELDLRKGPANPAMFTTDHEVVAVAYRQLVTTLEKDRAFNLAESCKVGASEAQLAVSRGLSRLGWLIYRTSSLYGSSWERAFGVLLLLGLIFSALFAGLGFSEVNTPHSVTVPEDLWTPSGLRTFAEDFISNFTRAVILTGSILFRSPTDLKPLGLISQIAAWLSSIVLTTQLALLILALRRRFRH